MHEQLGRDVSDRVTAKLGLDPEDVELVGVWVGPGARWVEVHVTTHVLAPAQARDSFELDPYGLATVRRYYEMDGLDFQECLIDRVTDADWEALKADAEDRLQRALVRFDQAVFYPRTVELAVRLQAEDRVTQALRDLSKGMWAGEHDR